MLRVAPEMSARDLTSFWRDMKRGFGPFSGRRLCVDFNIMGMRGRCIPCTWIVRHNRDVDATGHADRMQKSNACTTTALH
jgi:hypothetical protein